MGNNLQQNILADTLDAAGIMAQYDGWAVRIVSQKIILAWITDIQMLTAVEKVR